MLVREFDPVRYRRICKDVDRIVVRLLAGAIGRFLPETRTCELDDPYVSREETTPELIAAVIVHEAAHAHLHSKGIGYPESRRARIEDFCVRQEWLFGQKLKNGDEVCARADRYFDAPPPDFSREAQLNRQFDGLIQNLQRIGFSEKRARRLMGIARWAVRRKRRAAQT